MKPKPDRRAQTRLGRAARATSKVAAATAARRQPEHRRSTNWLRDVILGGQDGLVNIGLGAAAIGFLVGGLLGAAA